MVRAVVSMARRTIDDIRPDVSDRERADTRTGSRLGDLGRLTEVLGTGGMAAVYELERPCGIRHAVKLLHPRHRDIPELRDRFRREARLTRLGDHDSALEVHEVGTTEEDEPFFVMERLRGVTLAESLEAGEVWPTEPALRLARRVLDILQAYHDEGVVHRYIKPSNVFVTRRGAARVLDFGVACHPEDELDDGESSNAFGTPAFMAPEQAVLLGHQLDCRTDVFSVGAILYRLLSGERIRSQEGDDISLTQVLTSSIPSLGEHERSWPEGVVELVDCAMARERNRRFENAAAMSRAIEGVLGRIEEDVSARETAVDESGDLSTDSAEDHTLPRSFEPEPTRELDAEQRRELVRRAFGE